MYTGLIISFLGYTFAVLGAIPDAEGNTDDTMITIGAIGYLAGGIIQIISINKIGTAGDHLKKIGKK